MANKAIISLLAACGLLAGATAAAAATAHNSQAGAYGNTKHICWPTPYFREGGCASAAVQDERRYPFWLEAEPPREGPPLTSPYR